MWALNIHLHSLWHIVLLHNQYNSTYSASDVQHTLNIIPLVSHADSENESNYLKKFNWVEFTTSIYEICTGPWSYTTTAKHQNCQTELLCCSEWILFRIWLSYSDTCQVTKAVSEIILFLLFFQFKNCQPPCDISQPYVEQECIRTGAQSKSV